MKNVVSRFCFLLVCMLGAAALLSAQDGAALYGKYCAVCHETAGGDARAPARAVLRQLSPEQILLTLEAGVMFYQGLERSPAERRAIAQYLSDKPFGSEPLNPIPKSAFCSTQEEFQDPLKKPAWNGWGVDLSNRRFQSAEAAGFTAEQIPRLKLKWAFGFPMVINSSAQPVVVGGRVFIGSYGGSVFSLDAKTGCIYWMLQAQAGVRSAVVIGDSGGGRLTAYFGDLEANVYAADAKTGKLLWKVKVDDHQVAHVTASPKLYAGKLFVPLASSEEARGGITDYQCCTFRGSLVALDSATGKLIWKAYAIPQEPHATVRSSAGTQLWGPSGAGIWASPTLDLKAGAIYVATGNSYSKPDSVASDAVIALDMKSGKMRWVRQFTQGDTWNDSCQKPGPNACPNEDAPDFDFGTSPILVELRGGMRALVAGQKSGTLHVIDPDKKGKVIWEQPLAKGGPLGGIEWGPAVDGKNVYVAISDFSRHAGVPDPKAGGGLFALDLNSGQKLWYAAPPRCGDRVRCSPAQLAAVSVIPGAVFSGSADGHIRAYSTTDGKVLWDFDTAKEFQTVNSVKANGGAIDSAGPAIVSGMLFVSSGSAKVLAGNVLLAFSVVDE